MASSNATTSNRQAALDATDSAKDAEKLTTSADAMRAPNDPTTDPYHTRGIDPAAAEAGFRAAGYPERGPLAHRQPGDKLDIADVGGTGIDGAGNTGDPVAIVPRGGLPNPTADQVGPAGGVIGEDALIDDHSKAAHPDPDADKATAAANAQADADRAAAAKAAKAAPVAGTPVAVARPATSKSGATPVKTTTKASSPSTAKAPTKK